MKDKYKTKKQLISELEEIRQRVGELEQLQTNHKLAEDKLKLTQFAVDRGGDAAVWVNQNGQFTYVNDAACQSLGYSQQELLSMTVFDTDPDFSKDNFDNLWKELRNVKTATFESRHRSKDGSIFPVEITANMHKYAGEEHLFTFSRNITERKIAEETLRESEERYRTIVENTNDLISETDIRGRITYASPNHFEILGYEPEEMLGKDAFTFVHPDDFSSVKEEFYKGVKNFSSGHAVYRIMKISGDWLLFESSRKPFITATGEIHVVIQSRDITDKKRMEEELLKSQRLESIGILAGGIAHDYNNFLTSILGNISLIKIQTEPEDKIYHKLTEAEKACFRARDLTQQFLTFSKGGAPIKKLTSIGGLLGDVAGFVLRGSNVKCELTIPDNLWTVEVDEGQISQVIENLIINADQAMPGGGIVWLEVENVVLKEEDQIPGMEGKAVKITVKDKGIGISEEDMLKIFDPYFTSKKEGSGLGLAMVYSIVTKHGGSVQVKSKLGEGTTFFVYIPATDIEEQKAEVKLDVIETGKGNILFMDDEASVRKVAGAMLSHLGYCVQYASDGEETIEKYKKSLETAKPYDLIVVDLTIPGGMGGLETMGKLLEIDPNVSVLVSSGYWKDKTMSEYENFGFKGVITKPYNIEELGRLVHELIST